MRENGTTEICDVEICLVRGVHLRMSGLSQGKERERRISMDVFDKSRKLRKSVRVIREG